MVTFEGRQYANWQEARASIALAVPVAVIDPPAPVETTLPVIAALDRPTDAKPRKQPLMERYRPRRLSQVAGQDRALRQIRLAMDDNGGTAGGLAWWISGESGQGKTTIARCIAATIASSDFITEVDAGEMTPADISRMRDESATFGWGKGGRAFILNESHRLRCDSITRLLVAFEPIPRHVTWIFTTTCAGMAKFEDDQIDAGPLLSRCQVVQLNSDTAAPAFARLAQRVARRERLDGQPLNAYCDLVKSKRGNMRAVYQSIAGGLMMK